MVASGGPGVVIRQIWALSEFSAGEAASEFYVPAANSFANCINPLRFQSASCIPALSRLHRIHADLQWKAPKTRHSESRHSSSLEYVVG